MAASGLLTLADCVDFDHRAFWAENLRLFRMPSKGDLGRWLDPDNADVSEAALRKRADRFLNQYRHNEAFVLQDCRREYPDIDKLLLPLANELFLPT